MIIIMENIWKSWFTMLISDVQQTESLLGMYYQFYVCMCV